MVRVNAITLEDVVIEFGDVTALQTFRKVNPPRGRREPKDYVRLLLRRKVSASRKRVRARDYTGPWYNDVRTPPIVADGNLGYVAQKDNGNWVVNFAGKEGPEHHGIQAGERGLFLHPSVYLDLSTRTLNLETPANVRLSGLEMVAKELVYVAVDSGGLAQKMVFA